MVQDVLKEVGFGSPNAKLSDLRAVPPHSAIPIVLLILFAKKNKLLSLKSESLYGYKDGLLFARGTSQEKEEQHILLHNRFD